MKPIEKFLAFYAIALITIMIGMSLNSCGPSLTEVNARNKAYIDSSRNYHDGLIAADDSLAETVTEKQIQAYYIATDFGLPAGTVYGFFPESTDDASVEKILLIKILHTDGHISVHNVDMQTYEALDSGDILK